MSPLSIFNFESLSGFKPSLPKGLCAAAVLVLCLEAALRAIPDKDLIPYYSRLGFGVFMEQEVLPKFKQPQILIFGTSRAADAFMPKMIDEALGLPENSTLNLGQFGSRTSDWVEMYRRNRAVLSKAKLVVLNVDEWTFSSGVGSDEHFALTAPLEDRINFVQPAESPAPPNEEPVEKVKREAAKLDYMRAKRNRLLADWVFQMRLKLGFVPLATIKALHLGSKRNPPFDANNMIRSNTTDEGGETQNAENYHDRIHTFYKFFDTHPIYVRHVEELARMVKEDGGRFVLLHLPNRRLYQNEVDKLYPQAYAQHIRNTEALANRLGVLFKEYKYPEEIGLTDRDYEDYCHMAWNGTRIATEWFIDLVKKEKLLSR